MEVAATQLCLTLWEPMGYSPAGSSVHGILQARTLESVIIHFSRRSSRPRDQTWVSCIAGRFLTIWASRGNGKKILQGKREFHLGDKGKNEWKW